MGAAGVLSKFKALLSCNRLGELLVFHNLLTADQLSSALQKQKTDTSRKSLGSILIENNLITRSALYKILTQQFSLRFLVAFTSLFIGFAALSPKTARAAGVKDVAAQIMVADNTMTQEFTKVSQASRQVFGMAGQESTNIAPFTKWTDMFERFERGLTQDKKVVQNFQDDLSAFKGLSGFELASEVNDLVNSHAYIEDKDNWGMSDYWATPVEFLKYGGDCEDFAITKYAALRALGVSESNLRIAIVMDTQKNIPHAVLIFFSEDGTLVLDNQSDRVEMAHNSSRYAPIFSINRTAWWLHNTPTQLAMAPAGR